MAIKIDRFWSALLVSTLAIGLHTPWAWSLTPEELSLRAKQLTVIVEGDDLGSGAIVGREGLRYYVLTNWHVLKKQTPKTIVTSDGAKYPIVVNSIRQIQGLDLALCEFTSNQSYRVAELGNSDNVVEGTSIYITGAPANLNGIQSRTLLVVGGQIVGFDRPAENGYILIYNNNTMPGMSGGSVVDRHGNLVAIHGRGSRDQDNNKSGFNLGIPINLFKQVATKLGIRYTSAAPRIDRDTSTNIPPAIQQGRPRQVDGSDGAEEVCPGSHC
jgi:serine protease Do